MAGSFSFGFSDGFKIYGDIIMALINTITPNVINALTQTVTTSGVVVKISGILEDDRFGFMVQGSGTGAGNFVLYSGDYQNAGIGNYTAAVSAGTVYVSEVLDGSRFRKEDGSIDIQFDSATGFFAAWTY